MKVAAIQMVSTGLLQTNLQQARVLLNEAAAMGAELAVLPEYFCLLGQRDTDKLAIQEVFGQGEIQQFLADAARDLGLWIVGGSLPLSLDPNDTQGRNVADGGDAGKELPGTRVFNSSLAFSPAGACVARYDKIHLFRFDNGVDVFDESRVLRRGHQPVSFELASRDGGLWRIGMSVCYDLRFPELYRNYAHEGAHLLLVPSAFTYTTGQAHWEVLLRARAIENQAFVMAPAQGGLHDNGRRTWGHTLVVDPWGAVLGQKDEGAGVVLAELDLGLLNTCRSKLAALTHRVL
jgi:deaminated glutathione amidase